MHPPVAMQRGALISLQFLLIAGALYVAVLGFHALAPIILPLLASLLLTALLAPAVGALKRKGLPHAPAVALVVLAFLALVIGTIAWMVPTLIDQASYAARQAQDGLSRLPDLLSDLGINGSESAARDVLDRVREHLGSIGASISSQALGVAVASVSVLFGAFLTLVLLTYLLWDGEGFWHGAVRLVAPEHRETVLLAGRRAAHALVTFVRSQVAVAAFDSLGIAIGLVALGVPLVLPLTVLTFALSFIPYIGATVSGLLIALVALSSQGVVAMVAIIGIAMLVQFVEGHLVYPLLIGRNLKLHPITILLAVGFGSAALGVLGAFFATPVLAAVAAAAGLLPDQLDEAELGRTEEEIEAMADADAEEAHRDAGAQAAPDG